VLDTETKSKRAAAPGDRDGSWSSERATRDAASGTPPPANTARPRMRIMPFVVTLGMVALAVPFGWMMWNAYMGAPWTRDGTVRAYVVTIAPEVAGRVVELPVVDNQLVRKGDLLMVIDPTDYEIAVRQGEAAVNQAKAAADNAKAQSERREKLTDLAVTVEEKQTFASNALATAAAREQAVANLDQARVNVERTRIYSPVNGYVTNLMVRRGDYVNVGQNRISLVDADSFWVDGYFEEISLEGIREGDPASVKLMGYREVIRGHVDSIARAISVPNAQPNEQGIATVNPIFTWVRLAQRVPVRIHLDEVPAGIVLSAGTTATVQIDSSPHQPANPKPPNKAPSPKSDKESVSRGPHPRDTSNSTSGRATDGPPSAEVSSPVPGETMRRPVEKAKPSHSAHRARRLRRSHGRE
jgi:RND family efflux transporter MFP subunit